MKYLWIFLSNFVMGFFSMLFKLVLFLFVVAVVLVAFVVLNEAGAVPNIEQTVQAVGDRFT